MIIVTDKKCLEYSQAGHPEKPDRISRTEKLLREQKTLPIQWQPPLHPSRTQLERAHDTSLLERLRIPSDIDADTPAYPNILEFARASAGAGLQALLAAQSGKPVFSLMRPPGHHATKNRAMGFCYLNTAAIVVLEARATGVRKVAVYDFDLHHGNGTQDILLNHPGCAFYSIHQFPAYPGTGEHSISNCHNYPTAPRTPAPEYRQVLNRALNDLKTFDPELLVVSAGFDAFKNDPLGQEKLEEADYQWLGEQIRTLHLPTVNLLEGGYSRELPDLILAYLRGLES